MNQKSQNSSQDFAANVCNQRHLGAKDSKRFGLVWEEKPEDVVGLCSNYLPVLKEDRRKAISGPNNQPTNILIEGDNYHVLSVLNYTHRGKVDVIYIDPPYNTGNNDFIYNDNYVDKEDTYRHSKWLSFMSKRLRLGRELLKDAGLIFISIDANEQANLEVLLDEIFGPVNKLGTITVVNNFKGRSDDKFFATANEFLVVYAKNKQCASIQGFALSDDELAEYKELDEISEFKPVDLRKTGKNWQRANRPNMFYPVLVKDGVFTLPSQDEISKIYDVERKVFNDAYIDELRAKYESLGYLFVIPMNGALEMGRWRWGVGTLEKNIELNNVLCKKARNGQWKIYEKMRPQVDGIMRTKIPKTVFYKPEYNTGTSSKLLKDDLGIEFDNPKSVHLLKDILSIGSKPGDLVLDFFAGSGTTGHAVLALNKEAHSLSGGCRRFILCTDNENKIAEEITYTRIKRVIEGYKNQKSLGGNLRYFKTDFVPKHPNNADLTRERLTNLSTEMICVKENVFELMLDGKGYKLFKNNRIHCAIIFDTDKIPEINQHFNRLKDKLLLHIYIFSYNSDTYTSDFLDLKREHQIIPVPESILEVYQRIFKKKRAGQS